MGLFNRRKSDEHLKVEKELRVHDGRLTDMARRLRRLEIEAGIYKPPLKGVKNNRVA
jgi:hypothetical protein